MSLFENFELGAYGVYCHTTNFSHSLFNRNINLYLVSLLRYSMSKNVVSLKSGSKVTEGH